ncbi:Uncharacterized membrane protein YpjA [Terribacillus halophilus]|uniref:Uncharacterized membrane protein YpjA n=1 Tax=Terribacillus halophilus TaxID=361279 RepID=A0A1G6V2X1_9BACI|nr:DUF1405 domain-containing protein [Terribacillus halophilus]SDD47969.1 Uncharacterized membrane protein YpjA [Terribacillus halophilus]
MYRLLFHRYSIIALFIINLFGTIYGFMWYGWQLKITPAIFLPFVPDSPTASLFFTIFLGLLLIGKQNGYIEALAVTSLFKYGIWAVVMNILTLAVAGTLSWQGYMLIASHLAMAVQGILYAPLYRVKLRHLALAAVVILHNDIIDYVFDMMPIYGNLTDYSDVIGYFTFWLSIVSILVGYLVTQRKSSTYPNK